MSRSNILFILSGSIACYKACAVISDLVQRGHRVRTVTTSAARQFVGTATLEGLTREKVGTDLFEPGAALDHIALARWADATVVCPATANTVNRMAAGLADDLAGALLLAHQRAKPLIVVPAKTPAMRQQPATVASRNTLSGWGVRFLQGAAGRTACGEIGEGRMAEPAEIVSAIEAALAPPVAALRVLITSGGTMEPIDGVRVLTNVSTGATGALIANHFAQAGHTVTLLRARQAQGGGPLCREVTFDSYADLDAALTRELGGQSYDVVIHAAAVSDFSIHAIEVDGVARPPGQLKLSSDVAPTLKLRRNPKLVSVLRARSRNPGIRVVAFKLTRSAAPEEVQAAVLALFEGRAADFVVHNDLAARTPESFPAHIWAAPGEIEEHCRDRAALATALEELLTRDSPASREYSSERHFPAAKAAP
jgi:phosphopantothenoylcysteine decarboxylase/phosphopantothenate--cysteine ligase